MTRRSMALLAALAVALGAGVAVSTLADREPARSSGSPTAPAATSSASVSPPAETSPRPSASATTAADCDRRLQSLVDAAQPGSTVVVPSCTFHEQVTIRKPLTLVTDGAIVTGDGSREYGVVVAASDVTLDGFTIVDVANPPQDGAVRSRGVERFTFRNGHVLRAAGACISIGGGSGHAILDSELAYCGQQGYHLTSGVTDSVVARNHVHHNNPDHRFDVGWEAGGGKASMATRVTFEGNEVDHNIGPGIWCDPCFDAVIRDNRVHHNYATGIFYEIGSGGRITGNAVWENAWGPNEWEWGFGAGILLSTSRTTQIEDNVVAWNPDGIVVLSQDRADAPGPVTDDLVRDNTIVLAQQPAAAGDEAYLLGWVEDWSSGLSAPDANNRGNGNAFWHNREEPSPCRFAWIDCVWTLAAFDATPGGEAGRYLTIPERDAALKAAGLPVEPEPH